ncbi:hypothetical protein BDZ89DRAFT_1144161 [Hymenopellis radicata]|nr:hypothetical protein BDZ89DRAFT_1144161 [Hymenopellis radicata]
MGEVYNNPFQSGRRHNNRTPATKNPFQTDPGEETLPPTSNSLKANRDSEIVELQRELTKTQLTLEMTRNLRTDAEQNCQSLLKETSMLRGELRHMEEEGGRLSSSIKAQKAELDILRDRMLAMETYAQETNEALRTQASFIDRMSRLRDAVMPIVQCNICFDDYRDAKVPVTAMAEFPAAIAVVRTA